ncbi:MAG: tetratricopeptide repeat protein [Deltaproteobacteria bacterium]
MTRQSSIYNRYLVPFTLTILFMGTVPIQSYAQKQLDCGDGPRYRIDVKEFMINYSSKSFEGSLGLLSQLKIGLKAEEKTLQQASEATQQWNQFLIGLAEGYNSCAITKKQYQEAISLLYPALKSDAQGILDIAKSIKEGRAANLNELKQFLDNYVRNLTKFAQISGKEEIIKTLSSKVEEEHEKTREFLGNLIKTNYLWPLVNRILEQDRVIAELREKKAATEKELQRRGAFEALKQFKQGKYEEAEKLFQEEFQQKKAEAASAAYYLGNIKVAQSDFKAAASYYREAVQLDANNAVYLNEAGYSLYFIAEYAEAETLYKRSLAIREKSFGPNHPDVAASLGKLAELYITQGKYSEAESLLKQALDIGEKALGANHSDVGSSFKTLAELYYAQGRYREAESLSKRAIDIQEKARGSTHIDVGLSLNCLAMVYYGQGNYVTAESLYERALEISEKALGPNHPDVGLALNGLATVHHVKGNYVRAESLYKRSLEIYEKAFGPNHPEVGVLLNNLAELYRIHNNHIEAESLYKRSLEISEKALGPNHPHVGISLNNLGLLYYDQRKYAQAAPLYKRSLEIWEKALGPNHPNIALTFTNLGLLYYAQGKHAEAEPLYKRSLEIWEKALGPNHPKVALVCENLAKCYRRLGKEDEAKKLEARVQQIRSGQKEL